VHGFGFGHGPTITHHFRNQQGLWQLHDERRAEITRLRIRFGAGYANIHPSLRGLTLEDEQQSLSTVRPTIPSVEYGPRRVSGSLPARLRWQQQENEDVHEATSYELSRLRRESQNEIMATPAELVIPWPAVREINPRRRVPVQSLASRDEDIGSRIMSLLDHIETQRQVVAESAGESEPDPIVSVGMVELFDADGRRVRMYMWVTERLLEWLIIIVQP
jgi:hypothetical protein